MSYGQDVLGGATSGAQAGSAFGPWGAAIGGALGALGGLSSGRSKKRARRRHRREVRAEYRERFRQMAKEREMFLGDQETAMAAAGVDVSAGTAGLLTGETRSEWARAYLNTARQERAAVRGTRTGGSNFWNTAVSGLEFGGTMYTAFK